MPRQAFDSENLQDKLRQELASRMGGSSTTETVAADFPPMAMDMAGAGSTAEAIVIADAFLRPALLVRNNTFEQPQADTWRALLNAHRPKIDAAIRSVGRLELKNHPTFPYVGTAWIISERVAVTNRHVAMIFAAKKGAGFVISKSPLGQIEARIDFREEQGISSAAEFPIDKVLFISEPGDENPDVALVQMAKGARLPDPIQLAKGPAKKGTSIVVIGYPANDPRNPAAAVSDIFGRIFEVKRLSPGLVMDAGKGFIFSHDASTLGGNSGSLVFDFESNEAVGLHFGGSFRQSNFAVRADQLAKILSKMKVQVSVPPLPSTPKIEEAPAPNFSGRKGYDDKFLGVKKEFAVPLPALGTNSADVAKVKGTTDNVLRYTHFSIMMNSKRRFAFFTAVNIDGNSSVQIRRANDNWVIDPRLDAKLQAGNELYANNQLDKGHLVRRLDPDWGPDAKTADTDTFTYTNATPQHARLNQGNWNDLEDYVLTNTNAFDLKVSVFTGPVFGPDDPEYRGFFLPQAFWKIVVVVNGQTKKLHATGYMLSQKELLTNIEFVFGQFRTYQVPISEIEAKTKLKFGNLSKFDPLDKRESFAIREIANLRDIVL